MSLAGTFAITPKPLPLWRRAQLASSRLLPPSVGDMFLNFACSVCMGQAGGWGPRVMEKTDALGKTERGNINRAVSIIPCSRVTGCQSQLYK